jgi:hypothetical protein
MKLSSRLLALCVLLLLALVGCRSSPEKVSLKVVSGNEPTIEGLPAEAYVEYFGRVDENTFFLIYLPDADDYQYENFRLVLGTADNLQPVKIIETHRLRDGGTTTVETEKGRFFFPSPAYDPRSPWEQKGPRPKVSPTFEGKPLLQLYPKRGRV